MTYDPQIGNVDVSEPDMAAMNQIHIMIEHKNGNFGVPSGNLT